MTTHVKRAIEVTTASIYGSGTYYVRVQCGGLEMLERNPSSRLRPTLLWARTSDRRAQTTDFHIGSALLALRNNELTPKLHI